MWQTQLLVQELVINRKKEKNGGKIERKNDTFAVVVVVFVR
jgi:hypothetical protein